MVWLQKLSFPQVSAARQVRVTLKSCGQRVAGVCQEASVDVEWYRKRRDLLYDGLTTIGYEMVKPGGAFYLFPRSPLADDQAFARLALEERLLVVPGSGFGTAGHFRIAYCTVSEETIERSLPVFEKVRQRALEQAAG